MAYTAQTVTSSGTELDFLTAVRTFFVNNQDITFTVEEEDLTNYPQYFIVSANSKLKIKVASLAATENTQTSALKFTAYTYTRTLAESSVTFGSQAIAKNEANRTINLFVAQKGNSVVINVASNSQLTGKGSFGALIIQDSNSNTVCWGTVNVPSAGSLSSFYDPDTNTRYKISPYHTYQKAEGQLFHSGSWRCGNTAFLYRHKRRQVLLHNAECSNKTGGISYGRLRKYQINRVRTVKHKRIYTEL